MALARAIERDGIDAKMIKAGKVVSGVYIPEACSIADLRREVVTLREQVQAAIQVGEVADAGDAQDVAEAVETAEAELAEPEPQGKRVVRKLKAAAELLTGTAETATAAGKVGLAVIRLAPVAMALWKLAERVF